MTPIRSIRNSSIRFALMATSVSIGSLISAFADTDHPVRYLHLQNDGNYTISDIELKWKTPDGKSKSNMFTKDLTKARGFCLDLEKFGDVPDGSEVWLKAYIALGDKESCRKDNPRIYQQGLPKGSATYTQQYKMGGKPSPIICANCRAARKAKPRVRMISGTQRIVRISRIPGRTFPVRPSL